MTLAAADPWPAHSSAAPAQAIHTAAVSRCSAVTRMPATTAPMRPSVSIAQNSDVAAALRAAFIPADCCR